MGLLGAFDVVYFHIYRCRLHLRPECQREVLWHTVRHLVYALQFVWVAHLRFHGAALPEQDARGFHLMEYLTRLGFGLQVAGWGRYLSNEPRVRSTFEFGSEDPKSLITHGRGVWLYERRPEGTFFKTVFDYQTRHGVVGELLDFYLFRPMMQLATEWSFETLRQWCAGDEGAVARRRSRWRFVLFFLARSLGRAPVRGAARSWLGTGRESARVVPAAQALAEVAS
ncbi:MAG: hypothetical protein ACJ8AT_23505 [Hyalangium sp.]|uniref:hypothetical protein n=1 Tax=Hyalangium sp. TaxID=2028555 RepID=UPI00389980B2